MLKRPFKSVIARIAIVALALSLVFPFIPAAFAQDASLSYAENGTGPVARFAATDQDGDPIVWSLGGADASQFTIGGGVLAFKSSPDYENPTSASVGTLADRNVYNVTLEATGGTYDVAVTVTNVDEDGTISFSGEGRFQPQVSRSLDATLTDQDGGQTDEVWQWARSGDGGTWTDIMGATSQNRAPTADDVGNYLRASVTYTDIFGSGKNVSAVTQNPVEARTVANAPPSFAAQDETTGEAAEDPNIIVVTRETNENAAEGTPIGKPVSASDADNDILVYTLSGQVTIGSNDVDADTLFSIESTTGQLKALAKLDYEDTANNPTDNEYEVTVTATDPSGAATSQDVTIELQDVNEAPAFEEGDDTPTVLNVSENDSTNQLRVGESGGDDLSATAYDADDEDADTNASEDDAALTLSGADAKYFAITDAGALTVVQDTDGDGNDDHAVDFEKKNSYSITVVATSGEGGRTLRTRLDVTVHVIDTEDEGTVTLSQREPQEGQTVVATVSDPDGGVAVTRWTWALSGDLADGETCRTDATGWETVVPDVTSAAYTPKPGEAGSCLRATVTYTDNIGTDTATPSLISEKPIQESDPANTAPKFSDQDLTIVGDQSEEAMRSVAENMADENVGGLIAAGDDDGDALLYTLGGDEASSFRVDNSGQIQTKVELDYETKDTYTVVLTATDPSGASDSILVTISVIDGPDAAEISGPTAVDYAENGTGPVATFTATDQDGDPIVWSLGGDDEGDFTIDGGVLAFKSSPNYENPTSASVGTVADRNVYNVTVQATGGEHDVAVTVTNVDEDGTISFSGEGRFQPQVSRSLEAALRDQDGGQTDEVWQWARSGDGGTWTDIMGATSQNRAPTADDVGNYLRASVTYTDIFGSGKNVSAVTQNPVEARTVANAPPSFAAQDETTGEAAEEPTNIIVVTRETNENAAEGTPIGKPVSASDADNDILVYRLTGTHGSSFSISETSGQLRTNAKLDYEDTNNPTGNEYNVTVTATDPSGAATSQDVTIELQDVNEAPAFEGGDNTPTVLNVVENTTQLRVGETGTTDLANDAYDADDEDTGLNLGGTATDADNESDAALSLSGADAKYFEITDAGALTIIDDDSATVDIDESHTPDFEKKSSYSITIVASSGQGDRLLKTNLDVTVHVIDAEDDGEVSLSQREPQEGQTVVATVSDPDGGVAVTRWTWELSDDLAADGDTCRENATGWKTVVPDVTSAAYTPKPGEAGSCLRATVTYTDNIGTDTATPSLISEKPIQESDPANTAPKFSDQDLTIVGDQSEEAMRSVAENMADENVGGPIIAGDDDGDALLYTLGGDEASPFRVDNSGQIQTKVELDYETKDTYTVVLTATDPSGASDSILVTISVIDGPDAAIITLVTDEDEVTEPENNAPAFPADSVTLNVAENSEGGANVGDPVAATDEDEGDEITYSLTDDSGSFEIWPSGQITVAEGASLDYETQASYTVTVIASDGTDSASVSVTINIGNVGLAGGYDTDDSGDISKAEAVNAVQDYFDDEISRDDVLAVIKAYFG